MRIRLQQPREPLPRFDGRLPGPGDLAQMPKRDDVLIVQRERRHEDFACGIQIALGEVRATKNDVAAHVPRLLRQLLAANGDCAIQVAGLPVRIRQRHEVATRILHVLGSQFLQP